MFPSTPDGIRGAERRAVLWVASARRGGALGTLCADTGMTVLTRLAQRGLVPAETASRVAQYTLMHMMHWNRHAIFRQQRWGTTRVFYTRWCDAPVALGLASAAALLEGSSPRHGHLDKAP